MNDSSPSNPPGQERRRRAYDQIRIRDIKDTKSTGMYHISTGLLLRQAIDYLSENRIGLVCVIDGAGSLAGVISERDVIGAIYEHGGEALDRKVDMFMKRDVYTCSSDDLARDVASVMAVRHFRHAPIVDDGYLSGMLSASDMVRFIATRF